jgi:hypothetical protein
MNSRTRATLAAAAAVTTLATACSAAAPAVTDAIGGVAISARQQAYPALVAFSRCVRRHGVPDFPIPQPDGHPSSSSRSKASLSIGSAKLPAAVHACQHVLPAGVHISLQQHMSINTSR